MSDTGMMTETGRDLIDVLSKEFGFQEGSWCDDCSSTTEDEIKQELVDANILFSYYLDEDYSGEAFVLYEKDGKLFEVNGSHCSCYGLEGQWEPEETTFAALAQRNWIGDLGDSMVAFLESHAVVLKG